MGRPKKNELREMLSAVRESINSNSGDFRTKKIPDIITFCEDDEWLGLLGQGIKLRPMQALILKAFYRGSEGNEGVQFEEHEIQALKNAGLVDEDRGNVVGKIDNGEIFRELVLVWGRRAGKDFLCSLIALYEAMRLLESEGGCPFTKYGLKSGGNPITILTIANSSSQSLIAFQEIKSKLLTSNYFRDKVLSDGISQSAIHLLTPMDRKENEDRKIRKMPLEKGGVVIRAGHSNSDSLLGIQCFVLLLDEVASFKNTGGSSGGRRIYEAMLPALNTFIRIKKDKNGNPELDENGNEVSIYDSKVVSISSPRGKDGILWDMFKTSEKVPDRLVCRLPTWVVNPAQKRENLRKTFSDFAEDRFMMEFGAEFVGTGSHSFFSEDQIQPLFNPNLRFKERGEHGIVYFAHLDPATSSHNYVLLICHQEMNLNEEKNKAEKIVIVDHLKVWTPMPGRPIQIAEIDQYMMGINLRFHLGLVTYDDWQSAGSIQKLQKIGMPTQLRKYNRHYKMKIYSLLEQIINEKRLVLPYDGQMEAELLNLQRRYDGGRGWSVRPNKESETPTDDICDALAGAVFNCLGRETDRLPLSRTVNFPQNPSSNQRTWMSMQGVPMGHGTGGQIAAMYGGTT